jgi:hypothetical protein
MYIYPHIAAELHNYRTTEINKAAERARLISNLAPTKTRSYSLWRYRLISVKKLTHMSNTSRQSA